MTGYGAVDNKPKSGVLVGTIVGVAVLAAAIAGFIYYQISEQRRVDEGDRPRLEAEHDALQALAGPLRALDAAATPETPRAEFDKLLADARAALQAYRAEPRRAGPLPSGRAWPAQFSAAERAAEEAIQKFGTVSTYLEIKDKEKRNPKADPLVLDTNISNVAEIANEAYLKFAGLVGAMDRQRKSGAWEYSAPR